jgi:hypothetical protein
MPRLRDSYEGTKTDEEWQKINDSMLEYRHTEFKGGNHWALLSAIRYCGNEQIVMPEWVVQAFFEATNKLYLLEVKTLDEAFGIEWPYKGKNIDKLRENRRLAATILYRVGEYAGAGWAIDEGTFEMVAGELDCKKTKVGELYYRYDKETRNLAITKHPKKPVPEKR